MRYSLQNLFSHYCDTLMKAVYEVILPSLTTENLEKLEKIFAEKKEQSRGPERDAYDYLLVAVRSFLPLFEERKDV